MADPWLLHTELHVAAVYDCCERTAEKGTAAKGTAAYGSCCSPAAKEMLRRNCCEQTAANGADQELHLAAVYDGCERTAEKILRFAP